jgi:hypothetical protein
MPSDSEESVEQMLQCPWGMCHTEMPGEEELVAHIRWMHDQTEWKAKQMVRDVVYDDR